MSSMEEALARISSFFFSFCISDLCLKLCFCNLLFAFVYLFCWWRRKVTSHNLWGKHLPMMSLISICQCAQIFPLRLDDLRFIRWPHMIIQWWWWWWNRLRWWRDRCSGLRWRVYVFSMMISGMRWRRHILSMWRLWSSENIIGNEIVPRDVQLIKLMEDNDLDHQVMKEAVHFLIIPFSLKCVCHFLNAPE